MHSSCPLSFIFDILNGALLCGQTSLAQTKLPSTSRYNTNGSPNNLVEYTSFFLSSTCQGYATAYQGVCFQTGLLLEAGAAATGTGAGYYLCRNVLAGTFFAK